MKLQRKFIKVADYQLADWQEMRYKGKPLRLPKGETTLEQCIICGKPMKAETIKFWVHIVQGGEMFVNHQEETENDMGYFPIGSECKNKLPKEFVFNESI